jgi:flagellar biosynthetic protein FliQ
MDIAMVIDLGKITIWTTILIAAPLLGVALGVGLSIGIVQAATSINEMTLSFIPKLLAIAMALALFGAWQLVTLVDFARSIFERIPNLFL